MSSLTKAARSIGALMLREMATTFGRTPGGYFWAVAEPVAALALLTTVLSMAFARPPLGTSFALFYATGYLPFMLYTDLAQKLGVALRYSRPLFGYPRVSWLDAILARFVLNTATHLVVIALVLGPLLWFGGASTGLRLGPMLQGLGLAALLGLGIGALNAALFELAPIWERAWAILNRPVFIVSGVMFLPEAVPAPFSDWLMLNPLTHAIALVRAGSYPAYRAGPDGSLYAAAVGLCCLVVALALLNGHAKRLLAEG
jgi:capsular polysaccharide transport system permease protein